MQQLDFDAEITLLSQRGVPLVALTTSDQPATEQALYTIGQARAQQTKQPWYVVTWDLLTGTNGVGSDRDKALVDAALTDLDVDKGAFTGEAGTANFLEFLSAKALPAYPNLRWFICFRNAHRYLADPSVAQGLCNLRNKLAERGSMIFLLGPVFSLPAELRADIYTVDFPLPTTVEIDRRTAKTYADAGLQAPTDEVLAGARKALEGLSGFALEQALALSLTKDGLNFDALWARKHQMVEGNPGLKIHKGKETYTTIGGCQNAKDYFSRLLKGQEAPTCIVFIDEIEKSVSGSKQDTSGVSQDFLGQLLTYMQDQEVTGSIFLGPPGAAKTALAKATGAEGNIPVICLDLGGLKGSLVGESEQNLRQALKVITAISQGKSLWLATCNSIASLPPELRRRFKLATFFFDLPTAAERGDIWQIYFNRFALTPEQMATVPPSDGWTGAEISACCEVAWRLNCTLSEAAEYIVPVAVSAKDQIDALRDQAHGRFISASQKGPYTRPAKAKGEEGKRQIDLGNAPPIAVISPSFSFTPNIGEQQPPPPTTKIGF